MNSFLTMNIQENFYLVGSFVLTERIFTISLDIWGQNFQISSRKSKFTEVLSEC